MVGIPRWLILWLPIGLLCLGACKQKICLSENCAATDAQPPFVPDALDAPPPFVPDAPDARPLDAPADAPALDAPADGPTIDAPPPPPPAALTISVTGTGVVRVLSLDPYPDFKGGFVWGNPALRATCSTNCQLDGYVGQGIALCPTTPSGAAYIEWQTPVHYLDNWAQLPATCSIYELLGNTHVSVSFPGDPNLHVAFRSAWPLTAVPNGGFVLAEGPEKFVVDSNGTRRWSFPASTATVQMGSGTSIYAMSYPDGTGIAKLQKIDATYGVVEWETERPACYELVAVPSTGGVMACGDVYDAAGTLQNHFPSNCTYVSTDTVYCGEIDATNPSYWKLQKWSLSGALLSDELLLFPNPSYDMTAQQVHLAGDAQNRLYVSVSYWGFFYNAPIDQEALLFWIQDQANVPVLETTLYLNSRAVIMHRFDVDAAGVGYWFVSTGDYQDRGYFEAYTLDPTRGITWRFRLPGGGFRRSASAGINVEDGSQGFRIYSALKGTNGSIILSGEWFDEGVQEEWYDYGLGQSWPVVITIPAQAPL
jgi:hypothetical protein